LSLLSAIKPGIPSDVETSNSGSTVIVSWSAPDSNGSPLTAYTIQIKKSDDLYAEELINCDGSDPTVIQNTQCTIPQGVLQVEPFNLG
jgi:hypothetical protein